MQAREPLSGETQAEYHFDKSLGIIAVPLMVDGKEYRFALVTATETRFGPPFKDRLAPFPQVPDDEEGEDGGDRASLALQFRAAPVASLLGRTLRFPGDFVICGDFHRGRLEPLPELDGTLGVGSLLTQVLQIDIEHSMLRSLSTIPDDPGTKLPITSLHAKVPIDCIKCMASVAGQPSREFYVMLECDDSIYLKSTEFKALVLAGKIRNVHFEQLGGPLCDSLSLIGVVDDVRFGDAVHDAVRVCQASDNAIGLGLLSRYVVTLDFTHGNLYLKRTPRVRKDQLDLSGLSLRWRDDCAEVLEISPEGSLDATQLAEGDEITALDGVAVNRKTRLQVRELLRNEGASITLKVRRGTKRFSMKATLEPGLDTFIAPEVVNASPDATPMPEPLPLMVGRVWTREGDARENQK